MFEYIKLDYFTIDTSNNKWNPSARFPLYEKNVYQDRPGSLKINKADWNTLGQVPKDYPGERKAEFGSLK